MFYTKDIVITYHRWYENIILTFWYKIFPNIHLLLAGTVSITCSYSQLVMWCSVQFGWSAAFNVRYSIVKIKKTSSRKKWYFKLKNSRSAMILAQERMLMCIGHKYFSFQKKKNCKAKIKFLQCRRWCWCRCQDFQMAVAN